MIATTFGVLSSRLGDAYIAGTGDGIVTVLGKPAIRHIYLLDAMQLSVLRITTSLSTGRYLFMGLDPDKRYLVMVRDYKKEFEPFVWDQVEAATDKALAEQMAMWQSFQTK